MTWYYKNLDNDLEEEIENRKICNGKFLDISTGPATQAIQLANRGFNVIGSDISETAVDRARKRYMNNDDNNNSINFVVDDILNSKFNDGTFDYIHDRECFHIIPFESRQRYVSEIWRILKNEGVYFLKCFSIKEPYVYVLNRFSDKEQQRKEGPYKFSGDEIIHIFRKHFEIQAIKDTVYQGIVKPSPRVLFIVMKKL